MAASRPSAGAGVGLTAAEGRVGRDGALHLRFERRGARTILAASRSILPLQVLTPLALDDPACVVAMLNPSGGVLGGDRLAIDATLAPGSHVCLTTPSATKVYRAVAEAAVHRVRMAVGAHAVLEWVPEHTIPFPGAALVQSLELELADTARAIVVDAFAAGRVARGEAWRFAALESTLVVRDATGEILWDRWWLSPALAGGLLTADRPYFATVAVIADVGLDDFCAAASRLGEPAPGGPATGAVTIGAGRLARRGALARVLAADAIGLARAVSGLWDAARATALGLPPLSLRKP